MRKVAIIGIGQTPVREHWDISVRKIASRAVLAAMHDAQIERVDGIFAGNMLSGTLSRQENLATMIADWVGLRFIEAVKVEAACGSGGAAFRAALLAVSSGELDSAVAVGVEKMTESTSPTTTSALATAADADYEAAVGLSFVAINALIMQRYLFQYDWHHSSFAPFSINAHSNAIHNPCSRLKIIITESEYQQSRVICSPISLMDASPIGDGSAAVVIIPVDKVKSKNSPLVTLIGSASASDTLAVHDRKDPLWLSAVEKSASKAYSQAGIGPDNIDLFELHDAFSIMSALSLEACGFSDRGKAPQLALDGEITPEGRIPISTRGGLKARGHPVGATGIYQIVEIVQQLRGEAGKTQVKDAKIAMAQSIGGSGATVITNILKYN